MSVYVSAIIMYNTMKRSYKIWNSISNRINGIAWELHIYPVVDGEGDGIQPQIQSAAIIVYLTNPISFNTEYIE